MGRKQKKRVTQDKETKQSLLNNGKTVSSTHSIDNTKSGSKGKRSKPKKSTYSNLAKYGKELWPYVWPSGNLKLQAIVVVSVAIIFATRGVNVLVPIYYKKIVNSLTPDTTLPVASENGIHEDNKTQTTSETVSSTDQVTTSSSGHVPGVEFRWDYILIFILLKSLHGGSGYLNCLRSFLWIRVAQNTKKKMTLKLFEHLHNLSVRWHVTRKTGEVVRVMDRGVQSITLILNHVLFNIFPVIADVVIAIVFFVTVFNWLTGLIVLGTMVGYLLITVIGSELRTKYRRSMNDADNKRNAASVDSILNFETVKYYCAEQWEVRRYEDNVDSHMESEWVVNATANLLNASQKTMMMLGLMGGSLLCAWYTYTGRLTVGDFVLFASYVEQLYGPLNMFGAYYRVLQQAFVDMEHMFEMLEQEQDVKDPEGAADLDVHKGEIRFENVGFEYSPGRPILQNINFVVPPGQTYALVGHSGGGKSTLIRLLFRFYDLTSGCIKIDGQDISKVRQKSLRQHIGVVPQDTVLFNQDIRYNVRYGRITAGDHDVENAARAADIHDKIVTLPDGYNSKVGERGLKLSGGEKQRIAIARTILKGPEIVLLDEATSALDTRTEKNIQKSLKRMCENKTTVIVAHRLSTVTHADKILVIEDGQIVEQGTDQELRKLGGHYAEMWQEQLQSGEIDTDNEPPVFTLDTNMSTYSSQECSCKCHLSQMTADNDINMINMEQGSILKRSQPLDIALEDSSANQNNLVDLQNINSKDRVQVYNKPESQQCSNPNCTCECHNDPEKEVLLELKQRLEVGDDSDEEISVPVKCDVKDSDMSDDITLMSSGREYNIQARPQYQRMVSMPLHLSMQQSKSFTDSNTFVPLPPRPRASTQSSVRCTSSPDHRRKCFGRQISCPSHKCRQKERFAKLNRTERRLEAERERARSMREESSLNLILCEDCEHIQYSLGDDDCLQPLDFSDTDGKEPAAQDVKFNKTHNTIDMV